jgi:hypothetical protein
MEIDILVMNLRSLSSRTMRLECEIEDTAEQKVKESRRLRQILKKVFQ